MLFNNTYKGKKVFLTGHTGFKGGWMLSWLHAAGADVYGYSLAPKPEHKLFGFIQGDTLCHSTLSDILNYPALEKSVIESEPDFIFHLAAQPLVRYSYQEPLETFGVNIMGTAHVLNAMRKLAKPCVAVIITTDKVYHNLEKDYAYQETDRLGGYDPYSASKAAAELVIDSYRNSYFNPAFYSEHKKIIISARAGNVIGGGDWATDRIVPDIVKALQHNEPVMVRNPNSVRPWQHVLEPVHAYLMLGKYAAEDPSAIHESYNFGPEESDCLPVEQMVKQAIKSWGSGTYTVQQKTNSPHEAGLLKLNIRRSVSDLKWHPVYHAAEAMDKTIRWYKNFDGKNASELISENIKSFTNKYEALIPAVTHS